MRFGNPKGILMNIEDLQYKLGYLEGMISVMEKDIVELKTLVRSLAAKTQPIGPQFTPGTIPSPTWLPKNPWDPGPWGPTLYKVTCTTNESK